MPKGCTLSKEMRRENNLVLDGHFRDGLRMYFHENAKLNLQYISTSLGKNNIICTLECAVLCIV